MNPPAPVPPVALPPTASQTDGQRRLLRRHDLQSIGYDEREALEYTPASLHDGLADAATQIGPDVLDRERFRATVAEADALARPEAFAEYQKLAEHYAGVRRWSPAFLAAFTFERAPAAASLLRAIEVLRQAHRSGKSALPATAPTGFVRPSWAPYVLRAGKIDHRHYELCVLAELLGRLQAGDVWVCGSRRYRSFDERLISKDTLEALQKAGTLPIAVEPDFERFIAGRRTLLDERLLAVEARAAANGSTPCCRAFASPIC